jgi:hypothetical protein
MKFLPSTTDTALFGWENFALLLGAVAIPGVIFFIWIAFFRQRPGRRKRRRRRVSTEAAYARTAAMPSISRRDAPAEPKS